MTFANQAPTPAASLPPSLSVTQRLMRARARAHKPQLTCVGTLQKRRLGHAHGQGGGRDREGLVQGSLAMLLEALCGHEGVGELLQRHVVDVR